MTLIIAKKFSDGDIHIISDIKLTCDDGIYIQPKDGMLKTWLIQQDLALSFAGSIDAPVELRELIDDAIKKNGVSWDSILELARYVAKKWSAYDNKGAEFLISSSRDDGTIAKVTENGIEDNLATAWIGDATAFEAFQINFLSEQGKSIEKLSERTKWSFDKFIIDGGTVTAGQFSFNVCIEHDRNQRPYFDYQLETKTIAGLNPSKIEVKAGVTATLKMGGAEDGTYSVSVVKSHPGDKTGVGLYFFEGKFGFFFCPSQDVAAIKYNNVNTEQFVEKISKDIGTKVYGYFSSGSGFWYSSFPTSKK